MLVSKSKFNWKQYIDFADKLLEESSVVSELQMRCGISRAYYGAYNIVVGLLGEGRLLRGAGGEGSHQTLINQCKNYSDDRDRHNIKIWRNIGEHLERLKAMRVRADYYSDYFEASNTLYLNFKNELKKSVSYANRILEYVYKLETK